MKFIFTAFLFAVLLASCKNEPKPLSEDFFAIAYDGRDHEITVNDSFALEVPKLKTIVFFYHDSIFKVELDHNTEHYSLVKTTLSTRKTLISLFNSYQKTTLKAQLKEIKEHGLKHGCYTDGYFLFGENNQLQFGLFEFNKYYKWQLRFCPNEIPLNGKQFPKIYLQIYHTFNSKWKDYYFSDEYHFKDLRVHYSRISKH
jgi:hypothetical protein